MIIFPAIDIKDGKCVRLFKGDFSTVEQVADSYLETAMQFEQDGAEWIHMVDLDGAKEGEPINTEIFLEVAKKTNLKVQLGGGIRNMETIEFYLKNGISRVIIGSIATTTPQVVRDAVLAFGDRIVLGIDAKNGKVATNGWMNTQDIEFTKLAHHMDAYGVSTIIYTDIAKDGTLGGIDVEDYVKLKEVVTCELIASGGIRDITDIEKLKQLGLYGAICGKSLYKGTLSLKEAIETCKN